MTVLIGASLYSSKDGAEINQTSDAPAAKKFEILTSNGDRYEIAINGLKGYRSGQLYGQLAGETEQYLVADLACD